MAPDLAGAYRACARTTRREARNFYFAFLSLPRTERRAVYALYAFCREADCVADAAFLPASAPGENGSAILSVGEPKSARLSKEVDRRPTPDVANPVLDDPEARRAGLKAMRDRLAAAADGTPRIERDLALADAISRFGVSEGDLRDVLTGVEMDLITTRIGTDEELRTYCYHVASAVGLATLPILTGGAPPTAEMREAAIDLGLGMQYVNILRDVDEDLALGRIYLPSEELAAHGVDETELGARTMTAGLRALLTAYAVRARTHLDRGRLLLAHLPRWSRACPWLLSEIYGRILSRIVAAEYEVFGSRTSLPAAEKVWLFLSSSWRHL